jgi:hypothetical protein
MPLCGRCRHRRRLEGYFVKLFAFGALVIAAALPLPASAGVTWEDVTTATALRALDVAPPAVPTRAVAERFAVRPATGEPAFLIGFLGAGAAQSGVPCLNCVTGVSGNDNIGLPGPSSYVPTGAVWEYSLSLTDLTYKGGCKLAWSIAAGNTVLDSFSVEVKGASGGGGYYLYGYNRSRPNYSGSAVLMGKATCGKASQSTKASLYFE